VNNKDGIVRANSIQIAPRLHPLLLHRIQLRVSGFKPH